MNKNTIAKSSLCILLILLTYASFSQSKKEQIETSNKRIDSLSSVIESERLINIEKTNEIITTTTKMSSLTDKINLLQNDVSKLNSDFQKSESELTFLKLELDIRQKTINDLRTQLKIKTDSLNVIKVNLESHKENMSKNFADNSSEFQTFLSTFFNGNIFRCKF
jgi:chromosome segregation ATPase